MENIVNRRTQQTRERLRSAAHQLFLQQGYLATSIDAILAQAGISSKETLYRHYANKEALFVDVLSHLTMEQPGFAERLAELPAPHDLASLRRGLTQLCREIVTMLKQPGYLSLVRMIIAESPRFPQLGTLFFSNVTQRGLSHMASLLQGAREQQIIADIDSEAVARMLLGGLLTYAITDMVYAREEASSLSFDHADAIIEVIMQAVTPR